MFRQRGALTVITPLLMLLVILLGVMALDGARLFSLRKEMQSQVNAAATAAANMTQSCASLSGARTLPEITAVAESVARQSGWDGEGDIRVKTGFVAGTDGVLDFTQSDLIQANAVAVNYQREVKISSLLPDQFGMIQMSASAAARKEVVATISAAGNTTVVGGGLDQATVLNSLLGALFNGGNPYAFSPTALNQLSDVTVRLGDLLDDVGVGNVVNGLPVNADALANTLAGVLDAASPAGQLADDLLDTAVGLDGISIEQVLQLAEDGSAISEDAAIPAYDLLISIAMNVLEGTSVMLNNVAVSIPGLAEVDANIEIFNAPAVVIAPARQNLDNEWIGHVETADVAIQLGALIDTDVTPLGTGVRIRLDLPIQIQTGRGEADLVRANCAAGRENEVTFGLAGTSGVASLSGAADINAQLQLLGIPITLAGLRLNLDVPVGQNSFDVNTAPMELNAPLPESMVVGGGLELSGISEADLSVEGSAEAEDFRCGLICSVVNGLLTPIVAILDGVIESALVGLLTDILDAVIDPLLSALGLDLGVVNIEVSGATQGQVTLLNDLPADLFDE